ncbi:MAG TPA: hypothetical protein HPP83_02440, partial [Candidatus Hydrogenedentes bacterium]|nr:hypothetical protein [Candidatus Hydrogenedentota bacterium]
MNKRNKTTIAGLCFALLITSAGARAETRILDRLGTVIDEVARGINRVGQESEKWVAPTFGPFGDPEDAALAGLVAVPREYRDSFPVAAAATVSVANEYGDIRVDTWDSRVVQIAAAISVAAESADIAAEISRAIEVRVIQQKERVEIRTIYPDTRGLGTVDRKVDYALTVPRDTALICSNSLGDIIVRDLASSLTIDSRFGSVDIQRVAGPLAVRAKGPFPLTAHDVHGGGTLDLRDTQTELHGVAGRLTVTNRMGSVALRDLAPESAVDIVNEMGPIYVYLPDAAAPNIRASALFGAIESDFPLDRDKQGAMELANGGRGESSQEISLHATFDTVYIRREGLDRAERARDGGGNLFKDESTHTALLTEGTEVVINATRGDLIVHGIDSDEIQIKETRLVRVESTDNAQEVLDALGVTAAPSGDQFVVRTSGIEDPEAFGCIAHRVDLEVQCPRTSPLRIEARNGLTIVRETGDAIRIEQEEGRVAVEHCKGVLDLTNHKGDIDVLDCAGPAKVTATRGAVTVRNLYESADITCIGGKTVVDAPQGAVFVRNTDGDVRIIALETIGGDYDVLANGGNVSIL